MTDRSTFVQALEANEDDVSLRMVFADWLEEHGEPEEAERQKQWPAAKERLLLIFYEGRGPDSDYRGYPALDVETGNYYMSYKELIRKAKEMLRKGGGWFLC